MQTFASGLYVNINFNLSLSVLFLNRLFETNQRLRNLPKNLMQEDSLIPAVRIGYFHEGGKGGRGEYQSPITLDF